MRNKKRDDIEKSPMIPGIISTTVMLVVWCPWIKHFLYKNQEKKLIFFKKKFLSSEGQKFSIMCAVSRNRACCLHAPCSFSPVKIADQFPQFQKAPCMFLVTGRQNARFIRAYQGYCYELRSFVVPTPHYSDRKGFFLTRGKIDKHEVGLVARAGAVYEFPEDSIIRDFLHMLEKNLQEITQLYTVESIILFTPSYMKNIIIKALPQTVQAKIKETIEGTYCDAHPFKLLEKIQKLHEDNRAKKNSA